MNFSYPVINLEKTGQKIKKLREAKNLSVRDLQEILGFESPQAIYKWQWGESLPTLDNHAAPATRVFCAAHPAAC